MWKAVFIILLHLKLFIVLAVPLPESKEPLHSNGNRDVRSVFVRDRESLPDYQPLCQSVKTRVDLHEPGYEFRPPFYHAVECKHTALNHRAHHFGHHDTSQICLKSGLSCVQQSKTIQIAKRRIGTTCWTLLTKEVHSGCECMWPVLSHGDSDQHL